jgi:hypothetical protein
MGQVGMRMGGLRDLGLGLAALAGLAACNTSGQGIPDWLEAQTAITWYYENNAWEQGASCIPPNLLGITSTTIVQDTPQQLVLDVRYLWNVEGQGDDQLAGVPCFGSSERTFVLAKATGGGYSVVSMTGPQRS